MGNILGGIQRLRKKLISWTNENLTNTGWSVTELSKRSGLNQSYISKVLNGHRNARLDFWIAIAQAFDAVPEMLEVAGILKPGELEVRGGEIFKLCHDIQQLDLESKKKIRSYVDFLISQKSDEPD